MELKRKVEYNLAFTFLASKCFKRYRNLTLVSDGVRYDKPSIATGMKSTLIFFKKSSICIYLIHSRCIIDIVFNEQLILIFFKNTFLITSFTVKPTH